MTFFSLIFFTATLPISQALVPTPSCKNIFEKQTVMQPLSFAESPSVSSSVTFLDQQVRKVNKSMVTANHSNWSIPKNLQLRIRAKRDSLIKVLYDLDLISRNDTTRLLSDKIIMAKLMKKYLGKQFSYFHPEAQGLNEFLRANRLVDAVGNVTATREQLEIAFDKDFPSGFIIKPAVGWSSHGETFYKNREMVFDELLSGSSALYSPRDSQIPFVSDKYGVATSGEKFMVMGLIKGTSVTSKDTAFGENNEYRVHTFYDKVVPGATYTRWYTPGNKDKVQKVEEFVQQFLDQMPIGFKKQMAYSFDIFITAEGKRQIIEVNTNRGEATNWSGFLRLPKVIGSYARFLRSEYGWEILDVEGWMFYNDLAHVIPFLKFDFPEWIKDAEVLGLQEETLVALRDLESKYILKAKKHMNRKGFLDSPDFRQLLEFGEQFSEKLSAVHKVHDAGWVEFVKWTKNLD